MEPGKNHKVQWLGDNRRSSQREDHLGLRIGKHGNSAYIENIKPPGCSQDMALQERNWRVQSQGDTNIQELVFRILKRGQNGYRCCCQLHSDCY